MIEENDGVCSHWKIPDVCQVVWIVDGWERDDTEAIGEPVKICDACRRILCTCERCSAYVDGLCCARPSRIHHNPDDWCRDGWQQARPWTMAEVREWTGGEADASEPDPFGGLLNPSFTVDISPPKWTASDADVQAIREALGEDGGEAE